MGSTATTGRAVSSAAPTLRTRAITLLTALLAAPAAVVAAPFWVVAAATRHLPRLLRLEPPLVAWMDAMQYVPVVGWRTRPDLDGYLEADHPFHFTTDAEGWRDASLGIDDADLLVFGDSYAFGQGVDDADLYSRQTGGIRTKPLGSNGYSMVHAVLWMEMLSERLAGRHVVWFIYLGNDLYDNLRPNYGRYRVPFVAARDGQWDIQTSHVSAAQWEFPEAPPQYEDELARLSTPGPQTDRALAAAAYLLDRAQRICSAAGADLTVLTVPRREQIDPDRIEGLRARSPEPERFDAKLLDDGVRASCTELGLPVVSLGDHLSHRDYFDVDIHWKPSGHSRVGTLLAELHAQRQGRGGRPSSSSQESGDR